MKPNYRRIYTDILEYKHPEKKQQCHTILSKIQLSAMDVINLNNIIFYDTIKKDKNKKHKNYDIPTIREILKFQKDHNLSNVKVAEHYGISRNTISKWKTFKDIL